MASDTIDPSVFSLDTREFIALLAKHQVRYVIVGGEAVIFHGHVRLTGDVDFFYDGAADNVRRLYAALDEFWAGRIPAISRCEELMEVGIVVQFGVPPNRIDLINRIDGVGFQEAWANRVRVTMPVGSQSLEVWLIGLGELIKNKESVGRPKDIEDIIFLRRARGQ
jgi:hypothetical protein